jgi:hypothetical protein
MQNCAAAVDVASQPTSTADTTTLTCVRPPVTYSRPAQYSSSTHFNNGSSSGSSPAAVLTGIIHTATYMCSVMYVLLAPRMLRA